MKTKNNMGKVKINKDLAFRKDNNMDMVNPKTLAMLATVSSMAYA